MKLLYFFPEQTPLDNQCMSMGLAEALTGFTKLDFFDFGCFEKIGINLANSSICFLYNQFFPIIIQNLVSIL